MSGVVIAGLTGGIASGKSTVAALFKRAGAVVLDADLIARQVVSPGLPAWRAVRSLFGATALQADGTLNRAYLAGVVFNDRKLRRQLEGIIHPHVRMAMDAAIHRLRDSGSHAVVIEDIPLLFETGMTQGLAEIIVVYTPAVIQLQRLLERDPIGIEEARARLAAQMPIEEKCRRGTIIINNSGAPEATESQALKVYSDLMAQTRALS
jgi:dephospho-CoA kinase